MTALVLDAGALVAVDRNDRATLALLKVARRERVEFRTNPVVVAQVWRDSQGRQANLARFLRGVDIGAIDDGMGRRVGELLGLSKTADPIDASVVLLARPGDRIMTSDPDDIRHLARCAGIAVVIVAC